MFLKRISTQPVCITKKCSTLQYSREFGELAVLVQLVAAVLDVDVKVGDGVLRQQTTHLVGVKDAVFPPLPLQALQETGKGATVKRFKCYSFCLWLPLILLTHFILMKA